MTLDGEHTAFVQSGVAIDVAGRDAHNVPVIARGLACRVSPDGRRATVFVSRALGRRFLNAVTATRAVAAVFCHPSTHRTVQLKGSDAEFVSPTADDLMHIQSAGAAYVADIVAMGYAAELPRAEIRHTDGEIVGVSFTVEGAFVQTPGPAAGQRL